MQVHTTSYKCDLPGCPNVTDGERLSSYVQINQFAFYYHNRGFDVRSGNEKHFCCKDHFMQWIDTMVG